MNKNNCLILSWEIIEGEFWVEMNDQISSVITTTAFLITFTALFQ